MSYHDSRTLTMPPTAPAHIGTVCDCGTTCCPDYVVHDRQRRASESDWMRQARQPANWTLASEAA
ncbi:hypothetical protein FHR83_006628 [Actinoplanes campanulatus]|uniref:Uncharacterized protein n=1 Tax=Actinoplanes campanulatus TaxID=113559 RepID=A0A7W5FHY0_9ACTN|nr:hypothetical protein [Actinoplanes campanulatus]MBB3098922.1 hypothetical protein [Actinoplanes campanulatus]GGN39832.1 hypothetical protein GCM10010109_68280 [Actinoplanes campanulatus]GID40126.1 hypothetical protein Aca09nite_66320 [Actinoplanes campanulatus]